MIRQQMEKTKITIYNLKKFTVFVIHIIMLCMENKKRY